MIRNDMSLYTQIVQRTRQHPLIMGIVNATPDSFSDGGESEDKTELERRLHNWDRLGVDIVDIGAESTRPGANEVCVDEQLRRLQRVWSPVVQSQSYISIDTRHAAVAKWAIKHNAALINDVSGGTFDPGILEVAADHQVPFVVMHSVALPATMQKNPTYADVVAEVVAELQRRVDSAHAAGVEKVIIDPGIGFGKTYQHNLALLQNLGAIKSHLRLPLMLGVSRKRLFAEMLGISDPKQRDTATALLHACVSPYVDIARVHNVANIAMLRKVQNALSHDNT